MEEPSERKKDQEEQQQHTRKNYKKESPKKCDRSLDEFFSLFLFVHII